MAKFFLKVKAQLDNVTDLEPNNSVESPYEYTFEIECTKCRTIHDKLIHINNFEIHEMSGSKGTANLVIKCKECKYENSINIIPTNLKYTIEDCEKNKFVNILEIDSRGLDVLKFIPNGEFKCIGLESGTKFNEVDLSVDDEWYDVDEKTNEEVSIVDVKWEVSRS